MPANRSDGAPDPGREPEPATGQQPEDDAAVPMNRAQRRAKGKHKAAPQFGTSKIQPRRISPAHAQRQYSNRRSGG